MKVIVSQTDLNTKRVFDTKGQIISVNYRDTDVLEIPDGYKLSSALVAESGLGPRLVCVWEPIK